MGILGTAKPLASLSSGLLARKGQARPAMRPQGFASMTGSPAPLDDLGWNDMGTSFAPEAPEQDTIGEGVPAAAAVPAVLAEREALARQVAAPEAIAAPEPEPVPTPEVTAASPAEPPPGISMATAVRIGRESAGQTRKGKAAFTLRLDADRHLRLRLASAVADRSAQALVAEALDRFLVTMPEVAALAAQLPQTKVTR